MTTKISSSWSAKTSERDQSFHGGVVARYNYVLPYIKGKDVLDIGSGMGFGTNYLASNGAKKVLGIDYSPAAVEEANKSFSSPNLEFMVMDGTNLSSPDESFDVITLFEIIEHLPPDQHPIILSGLKRTLKKDGICFISTPNKMRFASSQSIESNPYHLKEYEPGEFETLLHKYFSSVSIKGIRCVNDDYLQKEREMKKSLRYRFICLIGKSKLVRELSGLFPPAFRKKISSEDRLPETNLSDFEISDEVKNCIDMIALCKL
jgi:2-polyprenyl-3-methyl-5-hydroxy-6-metoxy-1,4-benzoquinol methylase